MKLPGGFGGAAGALLTLLSMSSFGPPGADAECKYLHVNITETMVMREFLFLADTTDCVNVKVYYSDTKPDDSEITIALLDPYKWTLMCDSNVYGQGSGDHTVLPKDDCAAVPVADGDTVWFYFGIEPIDAGNCTAGTGLTYDLMTTSSMIYDFCPANNIAELDFTAPLDSQGGGPTTPLGVLTVSPTKVPTKMPTKMPVAGGPTSSPTVSNMPTSKPTISKAPVTKRPTRPPVTAKPTGAGRSQLSIAPAPGGYIDPAGDDDGTIGVEKGSDVTFTFFPKICLEVDTVATGILYGHFDADYMAGFDYAEFPITYTPGSPAGAADGNTGEFSYPTGTDAHDHEYDEDCDCVYVDYVRPSASMERMEDIMYNNIVEADGWAGTDAQGIKAKDDLVFKLLAINGDINTAGFFVINDYFNHYDPSTFHSVVTWDDMEVADLPMYTWGDPTDPAWNPAMTDPALRAKVTQITEIAMGYKYDAIRRGPGGIIPTNTGDMKGNTPGQWLEWRNGALTMQVVQVDPVDGSFHCTMEPTWSNASKPMYPGDPDPEKCNLKVRSPQGPVSNCEAGYNVLYEGTLFWHWSGGCEGGSSSYHGSSWPEDYHSYFNADCQGSDAAGGACIFHKLCYVIIDGKEVCLTDSNQYTLRVDADQHEIEALFIATKDDFGNPQECPEAPVSAAPTISSAPTLSFSPTATPTISQAPSINKFNRDIVDAMADNTFAGNCWRWAHTFSCYPDADVPTCEFLEGDDAKFVADPRGDAAGIDTGRSVDSGVLKCCPEAQETAGWPGLEDVMPDCLVMEVSDEFGAEAQGTGMCYNPADKLDVDGKIIDTGGTFEIDGNGVDGGFGVKVSINTAHTCNSCYLSYVDAFWWDSSKGDTDKNACPGEGVNSAEPWGDPYNSFGQSGAKDKLYKSVAFGFKGSKNKFPYAFAASLWCGQTDPNDSDKNLQGCQRNDPTPALNHEVVFIG